MEMINKIDGERIGQYAQRLMVNHTALKNPEILSMIKDQFKEAKTTMACIAWYRSDLKKSGRVVAAPQEEQVERTSEVVQAELEERQAEVRQLEEELAGLKKAEDEALLAQEEEIMKQVQRLKELKKSKEEQK